MNGVACRHEMVARESVVTYHVTSHRGGNTSHHGGNVLTVVGMFPPRWKYFSPRWEHSHRGGNDSTAVRTFPPRGEHSHRGGNIPTSVEILLTAVGIFSLQTVGMFPQR